MVNSSILCELGSQNQHKKTEVVYQPEHGKPYREPAITVNGQRLQAVDKSTYLGSTLSIEQCKLIMRLLSELLTPAYHLADSVEMSGIEAESGLTQSSKSIKLWYCQLSYIHVRSGQCTNAFPKDLTIST